MNKKTLAFAVSAVLASGAATAANVYDADGLSFDVNGSIKAQYSQDIGTDQESRFKFKDAKIALYGTNVISDDLSVFGEVKYKGEIDGSDNNTVVDNAYIGANYGMLAFSGGRQANFADEFGTAVDHGIGGNYKAREQSGAVIVDKTNQVIKFTFDTGSIYGGLAHTGNSTGSESDADLQQIGAKLGYKVAGFDVAIYHVNAEANDIDQTSQQIAASYSFDAFNFGAAVSTSEMESVEATSVALSAKYTIDKTTFGAAWSTRDEDNTETVSQWHANVAYSLSDNSTAYAEVGANDADNTDMGYAVGLKFAF